MIWIVRNAEGGFYEVVRDGEVPRVCGTYRFARWLAHFLTLTGE